MSNPNDNILSLPPLTPDPGFGFDPNQLTGSDSPRTTEDLLAINDNTLQQKMVIDAIAGKTRYGMRRIVEMDQYGGQLFFESTNSIMKINEDARGTSYEPYHSAFNDRLVKTAARHIYALMEVGAQTIAKEVMRSTRNKPPTTKSFLKRLRG